MKKIQVLLYVTSIVVAVFIGMGQVGQKRFVLGSLDCDTKELYFKFHDCKSQEGQDCIMGKQRCKAPETTNTKLCKQGESTDPACLSDECVLDNEDALSDDCSATG